MIGWYIVIGLISMILGFSLIRKPLWILKFDLLNYFWRTKKENYPLVTIYIKIIGWTVLVIGFILILFGLMGFNMGNIIPRMTN